MNSDRSAQFDAKFNSSNENLKATFGSAVTTGLNYEKLYNKPQINSVELIGNKSFDDLGLSSLSNMDIHNILN